MGCGGSKGKIYLAGNEDRVKEHSAILQELQLSMEEGALLLDVFDTLESATLKETKSQAGTSKAYGDTGFGSGTISFSIFTSNLGLQRSKFALKIFAKGCEINDEAFPEQKMKARMTSHQFLKTILELCSHDLHTYAFDLYTDRKDKSISTKSMIKLVHETYDILTVPGSAKFLDPTSVTEKMDKAEKFIREAAGTSDGFQFDEYITLLKNRRQMLQQGFVLQTSARDRAGGSKFWKKIVTFNKDWKYITLLKNRHQMDLSKDDDNDEEVPVRGFGGVARRDSIRINKDAIEKRKKHADNVAAGITTDIPKPLPRAFMKPTEEVDLNLVKPK